MDNIEPVTWNKGAFNQIILPDKLKLFAESMVMSHAAGKRVVDPGTRMMLLHGPPGTGKTLTAQWSVPPVHPDSWDCLLTF